MLSTDAKMRLLMLACGRRAKCAALVVACCAFVMWTLYATVNVDRQFARRDVILGDNLMVNARGSTIQSHLVNSSSSSTTEFNQSDGISHTIDDAAIDPVLVRRQIRRRRHMANVCATQRRFGRREEERVSNQNGKLEPIDFFNIQVDEDLKVLYCEVPKVACTSWKRLLIFASGKLQNVSHPEDIDAMQAHTKLGMKYLPRLHTYKPDEIAHRISTYFKFLFVRNPFDRILSAYNDKFRLPNSLYHHLIGRQIVARYRQNPTNESLREGNDVTFDEFLQYLTDPQTRAFDAIKKHWYGFDPHWRSTRDLCHPCFVGYDFIGTYETLTDDVNHVLKLLDLYGRVQFPGVSADTRYDRSNWSKDREAIVAEAFANVSAAVVDKLWRIYFDDFSLFGYPYPSFAIPMKASTKRAGARRGVRNAHQPPLTFFSTRTEAPLGLPTTPWPLRRSNRTITRHMQNDRN